MSIFERLKKRQSLAVGDTGLYVQELTFRQINRVAALADADAIGTALNVKACVRDGMFAKTPRELLAVSPHSHLKLCVS